jgi:hypothetical protein
MGKPPVQQAAVNFRLQADSDESFMERVLSEVLVVSRQGDARF